MRLACLADAPYAFGSTLERERGFTEARWRARLAGRAQFAAFADGRAVGTAGALPDGEGVALVSMWVDPAHRGQGVGDALVAAVLGWAACRGAVPVRLWVAEGNVAAERLYARHGFVRTGSVQPVRPDQPFRLEVEMERPGRHRSGAGRVGLEGRARRSGRPPRTRGRCGWP